METPLTNLEIPIKKSPQSSFIKLILMIFNIIQIIHIFFTHLIDISPFYNYVLIFLGETYLLFIWSELREDDSYKNYLITIIASVILIILSFYYSIDALNYSYAFPLILILEYIIFYSSLIIIPISIIVFILVNYNYYYNVLE
jgi:hypothetical protein